MKRIEIPPLWLVGFLALAWVQAKALPLVPFPALSAPAGMLLIAFGLALFAAAAWEFRKHRTTIVPRKRASAFVTSGIFRITRNPIYLGDALLLAGFSLRWGSALGLVLVPVFMVLITRRFIRGEEHGLRESFGAAFDRYAARTRRWI